MITTQSITSGTADSGRVRPVAPPSAPVRTNHQLKRRSRVGLVVQESITAPVASLGKRLSDCLGSIMVTALVFGPTLIAIDSLCIYGQESMELFGIVSWLLPDQGWRMASTAVAFAAAYRLPKARKMILVGWLIDHVLSFTPLEGVFSLASLGVTHSVSAYRETPPWGFRLARYISVSSVALLLTSRYFSSMRSACQWSSRKVLFVARPLVNISMQIFFCLRALYRL